MVWRPDQLGVFLDHAADDRLYALWHLYAFRGLRRGEACGLEWPEVDLDGATISIVRQRIVVDGVPREDTPKSDAGDRVMALDAGTVDVMRVHRRAQRKELLAAGASSTDGRKVFTATNGSPCTRTRSPTCSRT